MADKVSLIIAVYNGRRTLERCLDSIFSQTYSDREIIVMDGGSLDGTVDLLKKHENKIAHWESKPDRGIYHAWNKAVDRARGQWVCFLGADDFWASSRSLERMMSLGNANVDLIVGKVAIVDVQGQVLRVMGEPWSWSRIRRWQCVAHPGLLHRRSLFDRCGRFDERYQIAADYDFLLRVGKSAEARFLAEVVVYVENSGLSRRRVRQVLLEARQIQRQHPEIGFLRAQWNYSVAVLKRWAHPRLRVPF
jgi:glycosyltransferase involved in cell wall biosynthesis